MPIQYDFAETITGSGGGGSETKAATALIVLLLLGLTALGLAMCLFYRHQKRKEQTDVDTLGRRDSVELGGDKVGLVSTHTTGGMDMSPIYTEGNGITHDSMDDEDLEEDYTAEKRTTSIVEPEDDDDEELLGHTHGHTAGGDEDVLPQEDPDLDEL